MHTNFISNKTYFKYYANIKIFFNIGQNFSFAKYKYIKVYIYLFGALFSNAFFIYKIKQI